MIKVFSVGKKNDANYSGAINDFEKRIFHMAKYRMTVFPNSTLTGKQARDNESTVVLDAIDARDYVILLDEHGRSLTSEELADTINDLFVHSRDIVFVIGGAYGVNDALKQRADSVLAFGRSVFPHQLVKLMVVEQIYRSLTIIKGLPYHNA